MEFVKLATKTVKHVMDLKNTTVLPVYPEHQKEATVIARPVPAVNQNNIHMVTNATLVPRVS